MPSFDLDAYFARIGVDAAPTTEAGLAIVQSAQTTRIPFENFDVVLRRPVSLDADRVFDKLIHKPRGGYCFEINTLLYQALLAIGFDVRQIMARVHTPGTVGQRTHMFNLVQIGGRQWIADGGFGANSLRAPIPLEIDRVERQGDARFRLVNAGDLGTKLQINRTGEWLSLYSFTPDLVMPIDVEIANHFTSTHPSSFFTWRRIANLQTATGRKSLGNFQLRIVDGSTETVTDLPDSPAYLEALKAHFGIDLDAKYDQLAEIRD